MYLSRSFRSGFTLIEIMIVVSIIGLLASIAIPSLIRAMEMSRQRTCIANLKQLEGAKIRWALEQRKAATDIPADGDLFGASLYIQAKPTCPAGGQYTINALETPPTCSSVGHTL